MQEGFDHIKGAVEKLRETVEMYTEENDFSFLSEGKKETLKDLFEDFHKNSFRFMRQIRDKPQELHKMILRDFDTINNNLYVKIDSIVFD